MKTKDTIDSRERMAYRAAADAVTYWHFSNDMTVQIEVVPGYKATRDGERWLSTIYSDVYEEMTRDEDIAFEVARLAGSMIHQNSATKPLDVYADLLLQPDADNHLDTITEWRTLEILRKTHYYLRKRWNVVEKIAADLLSIPEDVETVLRVQ